MNGLDFPELRKLNKEKPFNDWWPPVFLFDGPQYAILRWTWYVWLKRGWVNGYTPYRDLKFWDHNPRRIQEKAKRKREKQLVARRRYELTDQTLDRHRRSRQLRARRSRLGPITRQTYK